MEEARDTLEGIIDLLAQHMADAGITEDDEVSIRKVACCIANLIDAGARHRCAETTGVVQSVWSSEGHQEAVDAAGEASRVPAAALPSGEECPKGWLAPEEDALIPPRHLWIG